jgi:tetratricopeptide (TPR) repeat protein
MHPTALETVALEIPLASSMPDALTWPARLNHCSALLVRMFRDPRVLEPEEQRELIANLREAAELEIHVPEIRVLLGMALCVDLQAQEALEHLREAARQAPDCFIARLKFGELLMRLRICSQAAEETQAAARLATNDAQADLARRQAAAIRTMLREGVERGGYSGFLSRLIPFRRKTGRMKTPLLAESR